MNQVIIHCGISNVLLFAKEHRPPSFPNKGDVRCTNYQRLLLRVCYDNKSLHSPGSAKSWRRVCGTIFKKITPGITRLVLNNLNMEKKLQKNILPRNKSSPVVHVNVMTKLKTKMDPYRKTVFQGP